MKFVGISGHLNRSSAYVCVTKYIHSNQKVRKYSFFNKGTQELSSDDHYPLRTRRGFAEVILRNINSFEIM
ncbi:UNVERIFIED_CONTAM: hypothetical protein NCL1_31438 [Trichonephila clavipes]